MENLKNMRGRKNGQMKKTNQYKTQALKGIPKLTSINSKGSKIRNGEENLSIDSRMKKGKYLTEAGKEFTETFESGYEKSKEDYLKYTEEEIGEDFSSFLKGQESKLFHPDGKKGSGGKARRKKTVDEEAASSNLDDDTSEGRNAFAIPKFGTFEIKNKLLER